MMDMLPDVSGKRILELGCGYGATSIKFIQAGARSVYAFDISEKMIHKAITENQRDRIEDHCMNMDDLHLLDQTWDIAFSSLAFHYIQDLDLLFTNIYRVLNPKGTLLFSMEHPIVTAAIKECVCEFDANREPVYYKLDHYADTGRREVLWLDTTVIKYHRTVSDIIKSLIRAGFLIDEIREPLPDPKLLQQIPRMHQEIHRPSYLMCRCHKAG